MGWPIKRHLRPAHQTEDLPAVQVDRGGYTTYHGPGQLVGYLVVDVKARGPVDLVRWAGKRRGVTSHGFALNVDPDMTAFRRFVACGLADVTG